MLPPPPLATVPPVGGWVGSPGVCVRESVWGGGHVGAPPPAAPLLGLRAASCTPRNPMRPLLAWCCAAVDAERCCCGCSEQMAGGGSSNSSMLRSRGACGSLFPDFFVWHPCVLVGDGLLLLFHTQVVMFHQPSWVVGGRLVWFALVCMLCLHCLTVQWRPALAVKHTLVPGYVVDSGLVPWLALCNSKGEPTHRRQAAHPGWRERKRTCMHGVCLFGGPGEDTQWGSRLQINLGTSSNLNNTQQQYTHIT